LYPACKNLPYLIVWGVKLANFCQQVLKPLGFYTLVFTA